MTNNKEPYMFILDPHSVLRDVNEPIAEPDKDRGQCGSCGRPLKGVYRIRYELCTPCLKITKDVSATGQRMLRRHPTRP